LNGVLVLGSGLADRFAIRLEDLGYVVHAVEVVTSIDDIAAAILELKQRTPGGIGALAIGPAATLLLEAATVLPQLDAIVLFDVRLPAARPHYARMRVQVQLHRAEHGDAMTAADAERLQDEASPGHVQIFDWAYETGNDRFAVEPRGDDEASDAEIAWDRSRDLLATALPVVEAC
jgi:dienelactone hydrolase